MGNNKITGTNKVVVGTTEGLEATGNVGGNNATETADGTPSAEIGVIAPSNEWSADSEDDTMVGSSATVDTASCKDDPAFLYKDKPGFTCAFIGTMKPERCAKLHNGEAIGIASCPESCNMVQECLAAAEGGSGGAGAPTPVSSGLEAAKGVAEGAVALVPVPVSNGSDYIPMEGGKEMDYAGAGTAGGATFPLSNNNNDNKDLNTVILPGFEGAPGGDASLAEVTNKGGGGEGIPATNNGFDSIGVGTKSMADEIDRFGSGNAVGMGLTSGRDGLEDLQNVGNDYNNNGDAATNIFDQHDNNELSFDENDEDKEEINEETKNDWEDKEEKKNVWDAAAAEERGNSGYNDGIKGSEDNNRWDKNLKDKQSEDMGVNDSWNTNVATNTNLGVGSYEGGGNSYNSESYNTVPSNNAAAAPTTNTVNENSDWDYDDSDGFPTGLLIAALALVIVYIYRKSTQNQVATRDCATRGGYQPVRRSADGKRN